MSAILSLLSGSSNSYSEPQPLFQFLSNCSQATAVDGEGTHDNSALPIFVYWVSNNEGPSRQLGEFTTTFPTTEHHDHVRCIEYKSLDLFFDWATVLYNQGRIATQAISSFDSGHYLLGFIIPLPSISGPPTCPHYIPCNRSFVFT